MLTVRNKFSAACLLAEFAGDSAADFIESSFNSWWSDCETNAAGQVVTAAIRVVPRDESDPRGIGAIYSLFMGWLLVSADGAQLRLSDSDPAAEFLRACFPGSFAAARF